MNQTFLCLAELERTRKAGINLLVEFRGERLEKVCQLTGYFWRNFQGSLEINKI